MRIAFLTPEYPSEYSSGGQGLGTYVHRMTSVLIKAGHEPEVFVSSRHSSRTFSYDGICVHRVNWKECQPFLRALFSTWKGQLFRSPSISINKMPSKLSRWRTVFASILQAKALATTFERRHSEAPFDLVQSADYLATGLFVGRREGRVHVIRCSSAADLFNSVEGATSKLAQCSAYLERLSMKRADMVYAPVDILLNISLILIELMFGSSDHQSIWKYEVRPPLHYNCRRVSFFILDSLGKERGLRSWLKPCQWHGEWCLISQWYGVDLIGMSKI